MGSRMRRMATAVAVLAGALALPLAAASPAAALEGPEACEGIPWAEGAWELFDPPVDYVPPPLQGHPWSCAAVLSDRAVPDPDLSYGYILFYVDITLRRPRRDPAVVRRRGVDGRHRDLATRPRQPETGRASRSEQTNSPPSMNRRRTSAAGSATRTRATTSSSSPTPMVRSTTTGSGGRPRAW